MTSSERRRIEADYRGARDPHLVIAKCAAGLLVVIAIAAGGMLAGGSEDVVREALSAPRDAHGR